MGIAIDIISVIIKFVISSKVGDEVLSQIIEILANSVLKKEAEAFCDFINSEKNKMKEVLSKEHIRNMKIQDDHISYVIREMEYFLSQIKFTDELWDEIEYDAKKLEEHLWKRYCDSKNGSLKHEEDIKKVISEIAQKLIDIKRDSKNFEQDILIKIYTSVGNSADQLQEIEASVHDIEKRTEEENKVLNEILHIISVMYGMIKENPIESRTREYAKKWDQNMFLNNFDEESEKEGISVKLSEVYPKDNLEFHLPRFISPDYVKPQQGLEVILDDYIKKSKKGKMLLILGQSAIGKTTLITWITANYISAIDDILVYRFSSDLDTMDWQTMNWTDKMLKALKLSSDGLEGKTLIIDGFDEISVGQNKEKILNDICLKCKSNNFSVILTCRENYITELDKLKCKYIKLRPWNKEQRKSFCTIYEEKTKSIISAETRENILCDENEEVFGMPLILYMVLALEIDIKEKSSIVDVYDMVFDPEAGIYQRCINSVQYETEPRLYEKSRQIHSVSMEIAFWIFENRPDKAYILENEYQEICNKNIKESKLNYEDALIQNYFEQVKQKDSEGKKTCRISFVHDTIYVYFVVIYICTLIEQTAKESKEELAGALGRLFKKTALSNEILNFLKIKIRKSTVYEQFDLINETFGIMLENGMTYHTGECYESAMKCEMLVFTNMLNFICLWDTEWSQPKLESNSNYIRYNEYKRCLKKVMMKGIDLRGADLRGTNFEQSHLEESQLSETNLREAILRGAHLEGAELQRTNLNGADMTDADLTGAQLQEANLREVDFRGAIFDDADIDNAIIDSKQLKYLNKAKNIQNVRVYLEESKQFISYEEYCKLMQ